MSIDGTCVGKLDPKYRFQDQDSAPFDEPAQRVESSSHPVPLCAILSRIDHGKIVEGIVEIDIFKT